MINDEIVKIHKATKDPTKSFEAFTSNIKMLIILYSIEGSKRSEYMDLYVHYTGDYYEDYVYKSRMSLVIVGQGYDIIYS